MLTYAKYVAVSRSAKALKFLFLYDFRGVEGVNYLSSVAAGVARETRYATEDISFKSLRI